MHSGDAEQSKCVGVVKQLDTAKKTEPFLMRILGAGKDANRTCFIVMPLV